MIHNAKPRLIVLDCTAPQDNHNGQKQRVSTFYHRKIEELGLPQKNGMLLSIHRPEDEKRVPDLKKADAIIIPDSYYTPTKDFVDSHDWMRRVLDLVREAVSEKKLLLGISFGHEAIGAAFMCYPVPYETHTGMNIGYKEVTLTPAGHSDRIFSGAQHSFFAPFVHRFRLRQLPYGTERLAFAPSVAHAAIRLGETVYGVQYCPEYDFATMKGRMDAHDTPHREVLLMRHGPHIDAQNSLVLDNFLKMVGRD